VLDAYITQVQRLLHDPNATYYPTSDLTAYINTARGQIAAEGQCVRVLLPSTGPIETLTLTNGGASFTSTPTVTVKGTGTGATATATVAGNVVTALNLTNAGTGYDQTTTVTITGGGGHGATATAVVLVNNAQLAQEVYTFNSVNDIAQLTPGVQGVLGLVSVAVSWGSQKPMLQKWVWSDFQAYLRSNNTGLQSWPAVWSQYGQGGAGSIYIYPLPSQIMQWDWDCYCYPLDLTQDTDPEAIPWPWTDCVAYYAAYLAYDNSQRKGDSDRMITIYERFMKRARAMSEPDFVPDPYEGFY
jgi:hypothetical protein